MKTAIVVAFATTEKPVENANDYTSVTLDTGAGSLAVHVRLELAPKPSGALLLDDALVDALLSATPRSNELTLNSFEVPIIPKI